MPAVSVNGTELFYRSLGTGRPLLLMHGGLGMDHSYFHPWLDPLADVFELVSYDHRCNGRSGRPPIDTLTFPQLCADAAALASALGFAQTAVLGHSSGGFIALEYALRYPGRVSHLILVGTAAAFDYGAQIAENALRKGATRQMLEIFAGPPPADDAATKRAFETLMPLYFHTWDPELAGHALGGVRWDANAYASNERLFATYNALPHLAELRMPVLIVTGDDDFICPPSQAARMHAQLSDSTLEIMAECGHFPFVEQPEAFRALVRDWWKDRAPL